MTSEAVPTAAPFGGAVLCGGRSERMGQDKALLVVSGAPMCRRVADALWGAGATEVVAIGGDPIGVGAAGLRVHPDEHPGGGPLAATITALRVLGDPVVVVLSCDLLEPSADAVIALVGALGAAPEAHAAVPIVRGRRQWTHAAWRRPALDVLAAAYADGARSLHRAGEGLVLVDVPSIDPAATADADAPWELRGDGPPGGATAPRG